MGAAVPYIALAAAAALQYQNTVSTANRQDSAAAQAIRNQGKIQRQADQRVDQQVNEVAGSNSEAAREQRMADYMDVLQRNKKTLTAGLTPDVGSEAFKTDSAQAANDAQAYGATSADLMARIDAPAVQRQQEGFGYGKLAGDLAVLGRDSNGQQFLDQLRINRAGRRNAKMDLASGLLSAYGSSASGGGGGSSGGSGSTTKQGEYTVNLPF